MIVMYDSMLWKRGLAVFCLCVTIAFAVASNVSTFWVDTNLTVAGQTHKYDIGLTQWKAKTPYGDSPTYNLDDPGNSLWHFPAGYIGSEDSWKQAGLAAFALGWIGVGLAGIALFATIGTIVQKGLHKAIAALPAFISGFAFLLGAILYEGLRPSFHGDTGYNWPMGLYLTAGIFTDFAAFLVWWADSK